MVRHLVYLNSGNLNIRITPEIHSRIAMMAMQAGTTINGFIRDTLANVTGVILQPQTHNITPEKV